MRSAPAPKSPRQSPLQGKRIVVVDDNSHSALLIRQTLMAAGAAEVAIAGDGEQALALLATFRPDLLVTDLVMPVIGGLELVRAIRMAAHAPNPDVPDPSIPIVLVSAFGSRQSVRAAQAAGIDGFVVKPFSVGSLVKRVDRAGRRKAAFVVTEGYVGPERRGRAGGKGNRRKGDRGGASRVMAPILGVVPPLMLSVDQPEPPQGEPSNSLLKHLYERIRELEEERAAAGN